MPQLFRIVTDWMDYVYICDERGICRLLEHNKAMVRPRDANCYHSELFANKPYDLFYVFSPERAMELFYHILLKMHLDWLETTHCRIEEFSLDDEGCKTTPYPFIEYGDIVFVNADVFLKTLGNIFSSGDLATYLDRKSTASPQKKKEAYKILKYILMDQYRLIRRQGSLFELVEFLHYTQGYTYNKKTLKELGDSVPKKLWDILKTTNFMMPDLKKDQWYKGYFIPFIKDKFFNLVDSKKETNIKKLTNMQKVFLAGKSLKYWSECEFHFKCNVSPLVIKDKQCSNDLYNGIILTYKDFSKYIEIVFSYDSNYEAYGCFLP